MRRSSIYGSRQIPFMSNIFSTDLWTGNATNRTITTGVDLSGSNEGLVWIMNRSTNENHGLYDTIRGALTAFATNSTSAEVSESNTLTAFGSTGFDLGTSNDTNRSGSDFVAWTFKSSPGFFDIISYTGNGGTNVINHNLGTVPGCIMLKQRTAGGSNWDTYHRSLNGGTNPEQYYVRVNTTASEAPGPTLDSTAPTSTQITLGNTQLNASGETYVGYVFGHESASNGRIFCGGFTTDVSGAATVSIGWKPGWILMKEVGGLSDGWILLDTARGWGPTTGNLIYANTNAAEVAAAVDTAPTSTGFTVSGFGSSIDYIFVAIRAEGF